MSKTAVRRVLLAVLLAAGAAGAYGHPHMFLDSRITFAFEGRTLTGFWLEWTFDPIFTEAILLDHDQNRDRRLSPEEVLSVQRGAFENLVHYGYFTYIDWRGELSNPAQVLDFSASVRENRLVYRFFVPYHVEAAWGEEILAVAVYDDTFYCDCRIPETGAVSAAGAGDVEVSYQVRKNTNKVITYNPNDGSARTNLGARNPTRYTGMAHPTEVVLTFAERGSR